ncbi:MAG: SagB family peptide dehydrogenase [Acidobacteria bacterium]|nr:SagB family peptide dehydrogenase [Acidobacteriota bacterium]
MSNRETQFAWNYHNRTKHSYESVRRNAHFLDWDNHPLPFKIYPDLEPIALPKETPQTGIAALSAISAAQASSPRSPDLETLTHVLYFSAGITKRRQSPGGEILFRAAACTGALYEIELYLVCGRLADLAAGVYHFGPGDLALRRLREGDFRGALGCGAPAALVASGVYWRNAWKYQARTYRHFGWDNGTIHANLLAVAAALGFEARLRCGFVDSDVNPLLAVDTDREVALTILELGPPAPPPGSIEAAPLQLEVVPYSREEVDYPAMREIHQASSLAFAEEVLAWRGEAPPAPPPPAGETIALQPLADSEIPRDTIEEVILRRGSTRRFAREPITFAQLSTILDRATRGVPADFGTGLNDLYLIANAVEGLAPGAYFYRSSDRSLETLKRGDFRRQAAYLGLEQELPGDAAAAVFFLSDLPRVLDGFGNRGYRAVNLEAGLLGGKMYLAAYAQRLGATGLTFYDDEVVNFFAPHAAGKSAIFLVALGHAAKRRS